MYDINLSYMMYLLVSHYTADHHSAFCVLRSAKYPCRRTYEPTEKLALQIHSWQVMLIGTLRYGDYGLRTTDGRHFRTGTRHMCSVVPTVASSRRCVVEGFHVVQRGVVRGTEDGMKK